MFGFKVGRWTFVFLNLDYVGKWFWREERYVMQWPLRTSELDECYDVWGFGFLLQLQCDMPPAPRGA